MKKLTFILSLFLSYNAFAQVYSCGTNCTYTIEGETIYISGPTQKDEDGNYISSGNIQNGLFSNYDNSADPFSTFPQNIKNVEISGNITSIGFRAFWNASSLENVSISKTVTFIDAGAFESAPSLKNVVFEEGSALKTLEWGAFANSSKLENIRLPDGVETLKEFVFENIKTNLIIPNSVTTIENITFSGVTGNVYCAMPAENTTSVCENKSIPNLHYYVKDETTGIYEVEGKYYANANLLTNGIACTDKQNCKDILSAADQRVPFKVGNKFYASLNDLINHNYIKKRIYTIDEANRVAGPINRISIRYR